jgi:hypothetical protein
LNWSHRRTRSIRHQRPYPAGDSLECRQGMGSQVVSRIECGPANASAVSGGSRRHRRGPANRFRHKAHGVPEVHDRNEGASDTLLVFEDINGEPRYLSGDDDSGEEWNANITYKLFEGRSYIVRLRLTTRVFRARRR